MPYRYKLTIEYDGAPFVGWQRQQNGFSVQEAVETAAQAFCGEPAAVAAAGRTDAGVHAIAMCAHVDLPAEAAAHVVRDAINFHLKPHPIAILSAELVSPDFHARFSATARHYLYRFVSRRSPLALEAGRAWRLVAPIDVALMHEEAQHLVGKHDFSTFRAAQCQAKSPVKTLTKIAVDERGEVIELTVSAPSFLHHQVRSIAGTLAQVGLGRWSAGDLKKALSAADRTACGPVAPACGLYFLRADYDRT